MRQVLSKRFGIEKSDLAEESEISTLGLDSLGFIEYTFELESALQVHFPDLPRDLSTVGDFVSFVYGEVIRERAGGALK